MFSGQYPCLYQGTERRVPVTQGVLTERKLVRPVVMLDPADQLFIGIDILDADDKNKPVARWGCTFGPDADIVGAYRAMRLIQCEPTLSMEIMEQDCVASSSLVVSDHDRTAVRERVGEKFDQITCEMPVRLMDALHLLKCHDVPIATDALVQEIRAGRLKHTDELQAKYGVEHPDAIDERERRREALVEPFVPYFRQWLAQTASVTGERHKEGCKHELFLRDMAHQCLRRDVTDPAQVVGMSLAFHEVGLNMILASLRDALVGEPIGNLETRIKTKLMGLANFLVEQFEQGKAVKKTASDYYALLTSLKQSWDSLPQHDIV